MRLSIQIAFDKTLDLETPKSAVTVGRSESCDLVVPHEAISRKHCQIEYKNGNFFITDLGSSNGIYINGNRINANERVVLPSGAQLAIGKLECALSKSMPQKKDATDSKKIVSREVDEARDFTATIRLARLDIEREVISTRKLTLEAPKVKGPRNPVTHGLKPKKNDKKINLAPYILLLLLIGVVLLYLFLPS